MVINSLGFTIDILDTYQRYLKSSLEGIEIYRDVRISNIKLNYLLSNYPDKSETEEGDTQ